MSWGTILELHHNILTAEGCKVAAGVTAARLQLVTRRTFAVYAFDQTVCNLGTSPSGFVSSRYMFDIESRVGALTSIPARTLYHKVC